MARRPRIEVEGGLYHIITRGVDRQDIFHSPEDHRKFLALLSIQKEKLPFYLYAYCLMTNHIHLLLERRVDDIGKIMHRLLTGYGQYYNRRYRRVGHVLEGRHKAILCQSEGYLTKLVRYIHLNPVRAKMVTDAKDYRYSSHRAYLCLDPAGPADVDSVLRHFGSKKAKAREHYSRFMTEGIAMGHQTEFYETRRGVLGSEEFVDSIIHRIGEHDTRAAGERRREERQRPGFDPNTLVEAVERVCGIAREDFCSAAKHTRLVLAKETLIIAGRCLGVTTTALSRLLLISSASVSRRHDAATRRMHENDILASFVDRVVEQYRKEVGES